MVRTANRLRIFFWIFLIENISLRLSNKFVITYFQAVLGDNGFGKFSYFMKSIVGIGFATEHFFPSLQSIVLFFLMDLDHIHDLVQHHVWLRDTHLHPQTHFLLPLNRVFDYFLRFLQNILVVKVPVQLQREVFLKSSHKVKKDESIVSSVQKTILSLNVLKGKLPIFFDLCRRFIHLIPNQVQELLRKSYSFKFWCLGADGAKPGHKWLRQVSDHNFLVVGKFLFR